MLFIHSENQKLLWTAVQRLPLPNPATFKQTIHNIYQKHKDKHLTQPELRQLNRDAIFELYTQPSVENPLTLKERPLTLEERQNEYNPIHTIRELNMESISDTPIKNMEELLQRHLEERDKELANTRLTIKEEVPLDSSFPDEETMIE